MTRTPAQWREAAAGARRQAERHMQEAERFHTLADRALLREDVLAGDFYSEQAGLVEKAAEHALEHTYRWTEYAVDAELPDIVTVTGGAS